MIWIDLDGVLADFDEGYRQRFNLPTVRDGEPDEDAMWKRIRNCGDFFLNLPWTSFGKDLWGIVEPYGANVLTAVPKSYMLEASKQKIQWCQRELGIGTDRIVTVLGKKNKVLYCQPRDLLLDDNLDTFIAWDAVGGRSVLIPRHMAPGWQDNVKYMVEHQDELFSCSHSAWGRP